MNALDSHLSLDADADFDPFAAGAVERVVATSEAQREVWLADKLSPQASLAFNESVTLRLSGPLDPTALQGALTALVQRHATLRSTIGPDGTELLVGSASPVDLPLQDLSSLDASTWTARLDAAARDAVETPFHLESGPLFRASLWRLGPQSHVLLMTAHHIVCDGWSWGLVAEDLGALYAEQTGDGPGLDPAADYADYVAWEAAQEHTPEHAEHLRYWLGRYAGSSLPVLDLPTDRPREALRRFDSLRIDHTLDAALVADLRKLGAKTGASLFATLFSGFAATLYRLTGQDDLVIGVPAAGQSASGFEALVGHCVNLLPIRLQLDPAQPFSASLRAAASGLLDAFDHQTLTYGTLLKNLPLRRDPSRLPLVSVMFNVDQPARRPEGSFPGVRAVLASNPRHYENFELFVNAAAHEGGLRLECQYNTALYDDATVRRWLGAYEALLRSAVRDAQQPVGALNWLTPDEHAAIQAHQPVRTPVSAPALMHAAFVRQAATSPERAAVRDSHGALTYGELDAASTRLAHVLRSRGIGRGQRVGLCLARGNDMLVALLAVLKSGGTYVPLDPGFPAARLAYYAEDAALALLLTDADSTATAPTAWRPDAAQRVLRLDVAANTAGGSLQPLPAGADDAQPDDAAYIIYTSGSTGTPKGVAVPHRAVANFLASMAREPGLTADDKLAAVTTLSFDIAVLELMLPLCVGAEVVLVPRATAMDGNLLRLLLEKDGVTLMQATPAMWRLLLETTWRGAPGFRALVGGESFPADLAVELLTRTSAVWNLYGPTETTIWSCAWQVDAARLRETGMSIGRPIDNTTVWILDERLQPCPTGVPGEICIGGDGVALGYVDRPELTADRFVADPGAEAAGTRLYRTGDRGRWRNDGLLEHLGRLDFQVKVRGYRIELGEIESACVEQPGIVQSVVLAREDQPGDVRLVAYLVRTPGADAGEALVQGLRTSLRARLPDYMVPQHVVVLEALPLLPNGKIDRRALPAPSATAPVGSGERVAARTPLEASIVAAMEAILNLPGLSIHDDFFALGGHSLLAARLTSRLNREFELNLPLRTLFESPTPARLAAAVADAQGHGAPRREPIHHEPGRRVAPLTPMQERMRFVEELYPGRVVYNTPSAHRLRGSLDLAVFTAALQWVVQRQGALRTRVAPAEGGHGHVQIVEDHVDVDLPYIDLSTVPQAQRIDTLMARMQAVVDTPMDITAPPLFRTALYKLADDDHGFLFMPHHMVWDGWSFDLFYEDFSAAYAALTAREEPRLPPLAVSYGDYAQWLDRWLQGPECAAQLQFWKQRFATSPMPKALRPDHARRAGMSGEGASEWVRVDRATTERLHEIALQSGVTVNMLTMALYTAMIASAADSASVVIGMPVRGRSSDVLEPVMGFFNNLLPVQLGVPLDLTFPEFLVRLKADLLEVFSHQDVPFERVAAEPEVAARSQRVGLYQALFSFQDARGRTHQWGPLHHERILIFQKGATEDLGLWLMETPAGLEGGFTYNADLYTADTARTLRERYLELMQRLVAAPRQTLAALVDPTGSAAAQALKRLGAAPQALPAAAPPAPRAADAASATPNELALAAVWAKVLNLAAATITPDDNFFDLGGDSLLAMRAVEAAQASLGFRVDARRYIYESLSQIASADAAAQMAEKSAPPQVPAKPAGGLLGRFFGRKG